MVNHHEKPPFGKMNLIQIQDYEGDETQHGSRNREYGFTLTHPLTGEDQGLSDPKK